MKKILALLLAIVMVIGCFAGCSSEKEDNDKKENETTQTEAPVNDENEAGNEDDGKNENVSSVNKELNASKLVFGDTMELAEKIGGGAEVNASIAFAVTPAENTILGDIPSELSSLIQEKSDGSYEISLSLEGTMSDSGVKVVIKVGSKEITDVIYTADAKIFVNLKSVYNLAKEFIGFNLPIDLPADYMELTDLLSFLDMLEILSIDEEFLSMEDLIWQMFTAELSEEELMMLVGLVGDEEMSAEFAYIFEMFEGITSTILENAELNAFLNSILVKASEANLFAVTENSISLNLNKDSVVNTVNGVCGVVVSDAVVAIDSVVNGLNSLETLDPDLKAGLAEFNKEEIQKEIEEAINVDEITKAIEDDLAEIGTSYISAEFSVTDTEMKEKAEIFIDCTNIDDEINETLKNIKISSSASLALKAVDEVKAPSSVFGAQDLEMFSDLFGMFM